MNAAAQSHLAVMARYFHLEVFEAGTPDAQLAELYALRFQVYCIEREFLPPLRFPLGLESDAEDSRSVHFASRNNEGVLAGTARLILPRADRDFPFVKHCPAHEGFCRPPAEASAEVSRLAVSRSYRRREGDTLFGVNEEEIGKAPEQGSEGSGFRRVNAPLLVLGLYREMYRYSRANGIRYWYAAMERSLARVLSRYGFDFQPIGEERDYYGPVRPYLGDLEALEQALEDADPSMLWWFQHGP